MRTYYTLVLALDIILNFIETSSGASPKERDFLTNFGMKSEPADHTDGVPSRSEFGYENIDYCFCRKTVEELTAGDVPYPKSGGNDTLYISLCVPPKERDFLSNFGIKSEAVNHQELSSQFKFLPVKRDHSPQRTFPSAEPLLGAGSSSPAATADASVRPRSPAEPSLRIRSRSPPKKYHPSFILGYAPEKINLIRLIPHTNPHQQFQIQKYTFPADKPIKVKVGSAGYKQMTTEERYVLITSAGDALAILESNSVFRGIYAVKDDYIRRAKINVHSGAVHDMTPEDCKESPIGTHNTIRKNFKIVYLNGITPHILSQIKSETII